MRLTQLQAVEDVQPFGRAGQSLKMGLTAVFRRQVIGIAAGGGHIAVIGYRQGGQTPAGGGLRQPFRAVAAVKGINRMRMAVGQKHVLRLLTVKIQYCFEFFERKAGILKASLFGFPGFAGSTI